MEVKTSLTIDNVAVKLTKEISRNGINLKFYSPLEYSDPNFYYISLNNRVISKMTIAGEFDYSDAFVDELKFEDVV